MASSSGLRLALALAGVGLPGVLDYSVFKRHRELGIGLAIGARAGEIVRSVTLRTIAVVLGGAATGLGLGFVGARPVCAS